MKKLITLLLVVVLCFSFVACGNVDEQVNNANVVEEKKEEKPMDGDFRYGNWGDSMETVETYEPTECDVRGEELLVYKDIKLLTYNVDGAYYFRNNRLNGGMYFITDTHSNYDSYIDDFRNINDALKEKYGEPSVDEEQWAGDLLKDVPGIALFHGEVKYVALWENDKTKILHSLSCDNSEIEHKIFYSDVNVTAETDTTGL